MTHLSDFSYCERGVQTFAVFCWVLYQIYSADRFNCLRLNLKNGKIELKTIICYLLLVSQVSLVIYDILATSFKYEEGFFDHPVRGIIQAPSSTYSEASKAKVKACGQLINLAFTTQSSALFLLLTYINSFVSQTLSMSTSQNKSKSLMNATETKVCMIYSTASIFVYPLLSFTIQDSLLSVVLPQVVFHIENVIMIVLALITNKRLKNLLQTFVYKADSQDDSVARALLTLISANYLLCICLFSQAIGLATINIDILNFKFWGGDKVIYASKALTDICTIFFSLGISTVPLGPFLILTTSARNVYNRTNNTNNTATTTGSSKVHATQS